MMGEDWLTWHVRECAAEDHLPCAEKHIGRLVTTIVVFRRALEQIIEQAEYAAQDAAGVAEDALRLEAMS